MSSTPQMFADSLVLESLNLLDQSMAKIEHCVGQLDEAQIWHRCAPPLNSIGNLLLHLAGNLRQWAVAGVGDQQDKRVREAEFTARRGPEKSALLEELNTVVQDAKAVIKTLSADEWLQERTIQGFSVSSLGAISHTTSHFVGHTHQIIFMTRLILEEDYRFHWTPDSDRKNVPI